MRYQLGTCVTTFPLPSVRDTKYVIDKSDRTFTRKSVSEKPIRTITVIAPVSIVTYGQRVTFMETLTLVYICRLEIRKHYFQETRLNPLLI